MSSINTPAFESWERALRTTAYEPCFKAWRKEKSINKTFLTSARRLTPAGSSSSELLDYEKLLRRAAPSLRRSVEAELENGIAPWATLLSARDKIQEKFQSSEAWESFMSYMPHVSFGKPYVTAPYLDPTLDDKDWHSVVHPVDVQFQLESDDDMHECDADCASPCIAEVGGRTFRNITLTLDMVMRYDKAKGRWDASLWRADVGWAYREPTEEAVDPMGVDREQLPEGIAQQAELGPMTEMSGGWANSMPPPSIPSRHR